MSNQKISKIKVFTEQSVDTLIFKVSFSFKEGILIDIDVVGFNILRKGYP